MKTLRDSALLTAALVEGQTAMAGWTGDRNPQAVLPGPRGGSRHVWRSPEGATGHRVTQQFCSQMSVHPRDTKTCVHATCTKCLWHIPAPKHSKSQNAHRANG